MGNEPKNEQTGQSECCSSGHKSCCAGKLVVAVLVGILLLAVGFCLGKNSPCGQQKICPLMQMQK